MSSYGWSYDHVLDMIRTVRPVADINSGFEAQLRAYELAKYDVYIAQQVLLRGRVRALQSYRAMTASSSPSHSHFTNTKQTQSLSHSKNFQSSSTSSASSSSYVQSSGSKRTWDSRTSTLSPLSYQARESDSDDGTYNANGSYNISEEEGGLMYGNTRGHVNSGSTSQALVNSMPSPRHSSSHPSSTSSTHIIPLLASRPVASSANSYIRSSDTKLRRQIPLMDAKSPRCRLSRPGSTTVRVIPPLRGLERIFCCLWCSAPLFNLASVLRTDFDISKIHDKSNNNNSSNHGNSTHAESKHGGNAGVANRIAGVSVGGKPVLHSARSFHIDESRLERMDDSTQEPLEIALGNAAESNLSHYHPPDSKPCTYSLHDQRGGAFDGGGKSSPGIGGTSSGSMGRNSIGGNSYSNSPNTGFGGGAKASRPMTMRGGRGGMKSFFGDTSSEASLGSSSDSMPRTTSDASKMEEGSSRNRDRWGSKSADGDDIDVGGARTHDYLDRSAGGGSGMTYDSGHVVDMEVSSTDTAPIIPLNSSFLARNRSGSVKNTDDMPTAATNKPLLNIIMSAPDANALSPYSDADLSPRISLPPSRRPSWNTYSPMDTTGGGGMVPSLQLGGMNQSQDNSSLNSKVRPQSAEKRRWLERANLLKSHHPNARYSSDKIEKMAKEDDEATRMDFGGNNYIHLEYLEWMGTDILSPDIESGEIKCTQCKHVIGKWTWKATPRATMDGKFEVPVIRIHKDVVNSVGQSILIHKIMLCDDNDDLVV